MLGEFTGINPGLHGLKIHEFGDLEYGCESTGEVFNPFNGKSGESHGDIYERRVGDIEQVQGRWDFGAEYKSRDGMCELSGPNSIIGRSIVLYERQDDQHIVEHVEVEGREGRMKKGAGQRIACCIIGLAKGEPSKKAAPEHARVTPKDQDDKFQAPMHAPHHQQFDHFDQHFQGDHFQAPHGHRF